MINKHLGVKSDILNNKSLDLIDKVPDELWNEVRDIV